MDTRLETVRIPVDGEHLEGSLHVWIGEGYGAVHEAVVGFLAELVEDDLL